MTTLPPNLKRAYQDIRHDIGDTCFLFDDKIDEGINRENSLALVIVDYLNGHRSAVDVALTWREWVIGWGGYALNKEEIREYFIQKNK